MNQAAELSTEAIESSILIELPDMKLKMTGRNDQAWKMAFHWYNLFVNKKQFPLGMMCRPCWDKVYDALRKAKQK